MIIITFYTTKHLQPKQVLSYQCIIQITPHSQFKPLTHLFSRKMEIPSYNSGFYYIPRHSTTSKTTNGHHLPCFEQPGKFYNICFRLADSQPQHVLRSMDLELQLWKDLHKNEKFPILEEQRERFRILEKWLHLGYGSCILGKASIQRIVSEIILSHDERECQVGAFVIMGNHIHLLIKMLGLEVMNTLLRNIKRDTALAIKEILGNCDEDIWMRGSFTRIVRSQRELEKTLLYIRNNPGGMPGFTVYERPNGRPFKR